LGLGFISLITLGLGITGSINSALIWLITIITGLLTVLWLIRNRGNTNYPSQPEPNPLRRFDYFLLAFIGLILFIGLQLALAPPVAWDGLSTHLVLVRDILTEGALRPSPYSGRPIVGHLLFVWGMALGGDIIPQLLSFGQAILMVAAVAIFSYQHFDRRTAILSAAFLCSVEVFIIAATWPYADVPTGMYALLAVFALVNWQLGQRPGRPWLILSIIFAVFSAHSKLNGLFVYPAMAIGIALGLWWRREDLRQRLVDIGLALIVGIALATIWTITENSLKQDAGNAVALISTTASTTAGNFTGSPDLLSRLANYFVVIWEMTIIGQQGGLNYDGTISPFFLILIPLLLFLPRKPRVVWALLIAALVEFGAWVLVPKGYYQNRHLILAYPLFSILAAYFVFRLPELDRKSFNISGFIRIVIVLVLVIQVLFLLSWYQSLNPAAYLLGLESRDQYLSNELNGGISPGYYAMMETMNEQLPEDSIVGVLWPEPRVYYCEMECLRYVFPQSATPEQMVDIAKEKGVTHLLFSKSGLEYWLEFSQEDPGRRRQLEEYGDAFDTFVGKYGQLQHNQDDSYYLYRLEFSN
jgi:4-amino-4-deoxy-L-arabinose transferase-like glycosyltransferase